LQAGGNVFINVAEHGFTDSSQVVIVIVFANYIEEVAGIFLTNMLLEMK
jgi:hypothetical protein